MRPGSISRPVWLPKRSRTRKIDLAAGLIPRRENAKPGPGKSAVGGFVSGTRSASGSAPVAYSSLEGAGQPGNQRAQAKPAPTPKSINPLHDVVRSAAAAIDDFAAVASEATQEPMHVLAVDGAPQGTWQPGAPAAEAVLAVEAAETAPSESARQNGGGWSRPISSLLRSRVNRGGGVIPSRRLLRLWPTSPRDANLRQHLRLRRWSPPPGSARRGSLRAHSLSPLLCSRPRFNTMRQRG